jgi:hypothetical protein
MLLCGCEKMNLLVVLCKRFLKTEKWNLRREKVFRKLCHIEHRWAVSGPLCIPLKEEKMTSMMFTGETGK